MKEYDELEYAKEKQKLHEQMVEGWEVEVFAKLEEYLHKKIDGFVDIESCYADTFFASGKTKLKPLTIEQILEAANTMKTNDEDFRKALVEVMAGLAGRIKLLPKEAVEDLYNNPEKYI